MKRTIVLYSIIAISIFVAGFFVGRCKTITKTEYIPGKTVTNTVVVDKPYSSVIPDIPSLPIKPDTVELEGKPYKVYMVVDTAAIIANYIKENKYKKELFDNNDGKLELDLSVQYNTLGDIDYTFTPMTKVITRERVIIPYIEVSYSTIGYVGVGGGVYYHNVGVGAKYITNFTDKGIEVTGSLKF